MILGISAIPGLSRAKTMLRLYMLLVCLMLVLAASLVFAEEAIKGKVVHVADGDTITVLDDNRRQHKIRLYGIDCPEKRQAFGNRAKNFTNSLVAGEFVTVKVVNVDRYGRIVGIVNLIDIPESVNQEIVRNGFAWIYPQYCKIPDCKEWKQDEIAAKRAQAGLWADKHAMPPWEWRKLKRQGRMQD